MAEVTWNLEYDAPQFLDFQEMPKDDDAEHYFAYDHERSKMGLSEFDSTSSTVTGSQNFPSELDSTSSTVTGSPKMNVSYFPVHNGPFVFKAKGNEVLKTAPATKTNLKRKSIAASAYALRPTPARLSRVNSDLSSPAAKKVRPTSGAPTVIESLRRKSMKHNFLLPRSSSSPIVNKSDKLENGSNPRKRISTDVPKVSQTKQSRYQIVAKPITLPKKRFQHPSRLQAVENSDPYIKVDFKAMLRSNKGASGVKNDKPTKLTVTKPFNFTETRKRKREEPSSAVEPYVSMAERLKRFENERGSRQPLKSNSSVSSNSSYRMTKPCTPNLRVLTRHREVKFVSAEEKERQEAEDMKKYHFKANPVNHNIFEMKAVVPEKKKATVPNFQLPSEKMMLKRAKPVIEEPKYEFRARPAPKNILDHVTGLSEKIRVSPTKPKTPPFQLKERANKWTVKEMEDAEKEKINLLNQKEKRPVKAIHPQICIAQQSFDKKPTVPAPFSFHVKDVERYAKRDERLKKELDELSKVPQFHALGMPSPSVVGVPVKKVQPPTEMKPFDLQIDHRGQILTEKWQRQVEEELRKQREAVKFKAQPSTVIRKPAFQPKKPEKPLTEVLNIRLHTEERAQDREQFDHGLKEKQDQFERERILKEIEKEKEDKIREMEIRAQLVHKANPVRQYQRVSVKPSDKELTVPQTPEFATDKRLKRFKEN